MEFTTGRRDGTFHIIEEGKNEEASTHPSFLPFSSSSSSPSTSTAFGWHLGSSDIAGNGAGDGRNDPNFFVQKEHMFDKVVTPSDVGKLNRLVIPKQHAEKYFPLDPTVNEKGLLLSFEDRTGKSWRFRYSYWNSSQSYVMTKGWSRFVKEKRLDAGDIVSFGRGVGESGRDHLYIDWRRRPDNRDLPGPPLAPLTGVSMARPLGPWSGRFFAPTGAVYDHHHLGFGYSAMNSGTTSGGQLLFFTSSAAGPSQTAVQNGGSSGLPMVLNSLPLVRNQTETRRVRLFGVNLDCPESEGNAGQLPAGPSPSAPQLQSSSMHPFLSFPHGSMESSVTSSSTSKEQQLTLDLGL